VSASLRISDIRVYHSAITAGRKTVHDRRGHPPHFFRQALAHTTVADSGPQWGAPEARPDDIRSHVR
jgi:hypothetical protein